MTEIDDFPDHPFKVRDDEDMAQLIESIKERGVITPATVRQKEDGRYELISGHRRKRACELAGFDTLRCEVVELNRDEATILMVESNYQRSQILPSEKAYDYLLFINDNEKVNVRGQSMRYCWSSRKINDNIQSFIDIPRMRNLLWWEGARCISHRNGASRLCKFRRTGRLKKSVWKARQTPILPRESVHEISLPPGTFPVRKVLKGGGA